MINERFAFGARSGVVAFSCLANSRRSNRLRVPARRRAQRLSYVDRSKESPGEPAASVLGVELSRRGLRF